MKIVFRIFCGVLVATLVFMAAACSRKSKVEAPPPPEVMVSKPLEKEITDYMVFTGQTAAFESVEIRAREEGWLEKIHFEPGAKVEEGDLLFEIDPKPFQAQVDQNNALLMGKKADLELTRTNLARSATLLKSASISQLQYDEAKAKALVAEAQVGIAEANLRKAKLDLTYTQIKAPIEGRVSRSYMDVGNLVGAGEKTLLTKIVNNSKIHFYFNTSERNYLLFQRHSQKRIQEEEEHPHVVHLQLADETGFPHEGKIDFVEPQLDPSTGTLQARAIFDNTDGLLVAGLFGRLRIPILKRKALLVPELAIGISQAGRYVLVINNENVVEQRIIETGALKGSLRVIEKGLNKDDRVVVNAIQRARPGLPVTPKETPIKDEVEAKAVKKEEKAEKINSKVGDKVKQTDSEKDTKNETAK